MVQGELFLEESKETGGQGALSFFSNSRLVVTLDKLILFLIASVVLFVLTYSFGYERGFRSAEKKFQALAGRIETITPYQSVAGAVSSDTAVSIPAPLVLPETPQKSESSEAISISTVTEISESQTEESAAKPSEKITTNVPNGKYTIQVATVLSQDKAKKEVAKLGTKGLSSFFLQRSRFFEVCVGSFENVASAKGTLGEFKTKGLYSDAFIRSIPRSIPQG